jgi:hypothetical protein
VPEGAVEQLPASSSQLPALSLRVQAFGILVEFPLQLVAQFPAWLVRALTPCCLLRSGLAMGQWPGGGTTKNDGLESISVDFGPLTIQILNENRRDFDDVLLILN